MTQIKHVLEAQQFDRALMEEIFRLSEQMRENPSAYQLKDKILATIFYEPSTRTRLSFEAAMHRLGGGVISTENAREFSSHTKGESLEDSIKVISGYADIVAIRHFEIGAAKTAASVSSIPIMNAGDGAGQHPTQSLLDMYTIQRHFPSIDGLTVCMVGDLKYGRTVRSLCYLLSRFSNIKLLFVAPKVCEMNWDIKEYLDEKNIEWEEVSDFPEAAERADVIYMTRVQKERFLDMGRYEEANNKYRIDDTIMQKLKDTSIVLHPLPRLFEIPAEYDDDPRMVYFEQAHNGVWVRMALISMLLGNQ